jgi:hypothetical protein
MRPVLALVLGAAVTTCVVGCTFLISFDDAADAGLTGDDDDFDAGRRSSSSSSGSSTSSSSGGESSSSSSSSSSSGAAAYPPPCDDAIAADQIDCNPNSSACGSELGTLPAGVQANDLVECGADGKGTCVRHCTMGCAAIAGLPSQCGNCKDPNNPDVWYCGKDVGFVDDSRDVAIHCSNGQLTTAGGSPATCGVNKCHTTCTRVSPPPLPGSCCQADDEQ